MRKSSLRPPCNRWLYFLIPLAIGLGADLWTKFAVFRTLAFPAGLYDGRVRWVVDDVFGFQLSLNPGALFGLGGGMAPVFAGISLLAVGGVVWWLFIAGAAKSKLLTVLLGLVTAGILGNFYDRIGLHGIVKWAFSDGTWGYGIAGMTPAGGGETPALVVRDWILVMIGSYHWPNFNLADCYLVCGVVLLFGASLFKPQILGMEHTVGGERSETGEERAKRVEGVEGAEGVETPKRTGDVGPSDGHTKPS